MTKQFQTPNPAYAETVHASFERQGLLQHLRAVLTKVTPGEVTIELPVGDHLTQQHGFVHAGAITAIVDSACGYAALSLQPPDTEVLTIEYKVNFMAPAQGTKMIAVGQVVKPGRTVTVCRGDVFMVDAQGDRKECATMLATMIVRAG